VELKLIFDEKEYRSVQKDIVNRYTIAPFSEWQRDRRPYALLLDGAAIVSTLLIFAHIEWLYYAIPLSLSALVYEGWTVFKRMKIKQSIKNYEPDTERFIEKLKAKETAHYTYDQGEIHYYERDELIRSFFWRDLQAIEAQETYFIMYFGYTQHDICLIPLHMTDPAAYRHLKEIARVRLSQRSMTTSVYVENEKNPEATA
jgi:hypothetical protein